MNAKSSPSARRLTADEFIEKIDTMPVWALYDMIIFGGDIELHVMEGDQRVVYHSPNYLAMSDAEFLDFQKRLGSARKPKSGYEFGKGS